MFTRLVTDNKRRPAHIKKSDEELDNHVSLVVDEALQKLHHFEMISYQSPDVPYFRATQLASLTARWYLSVMTAAAFKDIGPRTTFEDYLDIFARAKEFGDTDLRIKPGDKVRQIIVEHYLRQREDGSDVKYSQV